MDKKILYGKAYRILDKSTPLRFDCGLLCNSRCCSGNSDTGMHLYPGEEVMLENEKYFKIKNQSFHDLKVEFAICNGECDRRLRPIACRIFPLVPYISENGRLHIVEDPRAKYICPLILFDKSEDIGRIFRRNIYKVFLLLIQDKDIKRYLVCLSDTIRDYSAFTGMELP